MESEIKKCTVINDFSGFGRCSIAVALPVLSAMGIQCCAIPTAIFSNHTGYPSYFFDNYTEKMIPYSKEWKKLNLKFDTIYSGFLGCEKQIDIVCDFIDRFKKEKTTVLIDPVMGDNGKIYPTYNNEMCLKMKQLVKKADIITPNITEACILTDTKYQGEEISFDHAKNLLGMLSLSGQKTVLITGIKNGSNIITAVFDSKSGKTKFIKNKRAKITYPGTGDLFASVLCGGITNEKNIFASAKLAADFTQRAALYTSRFNTDINDGMAFEPLLKYISKRF